MKLTITDKKTGGDLILVKDEPYLDHLFYSRDKDKKYFTIAWNRGRQQTVTIDGEPAELDTNTLLPLMFNQSFSFDKPSDIVAWRFNREFYCVIAKCKKAMEYRFKNDVACKYIFQYE